MDWFSGIVLFVVIWWVALFLVLPFGVRGQHEAAAVAWGTEPGAPAKSRIGLRFLATTGLALVVWGAVFYGLQSGLITLETLTAALPGPDILPKDAQ